MKILVVSSMYPSPEDPSFGVFVQNFYENLSVVNGKENTDLIVTKGSRHSTIKRGLDYISFYYNIIVYTLFREYDLIYVHFITYSALPFRLVSLFRHLPIVINVHGSDWITHSKVSAFLKKKAIPLFLKAKRIVVPSGYFKDILIKELPSINESKVIVSYSGGINTEIFKPETHTEHESFVVGYVSHITEKKGWRVFVDAIKILKDKRYDLKAIIAGGGNQVSDLMDYIKINDLLEVIEYKGIIKQQQLGHLYNSMDVFTFPTLYNESLGLVGVEAMSCGVPVIGSNKGGIKEYLVDGENGYLFEPGDAKALSMAIERFMNLNDSDKVIMKEKAVSTSMRFDRHVVVNSLVNEIIRLV